MDLERMLALKSRLDGFIDKQRAFMYKPIQVAEILYHYRTEAPESHRLGDLSNKEVYRNSSKRWRDEVTKRLIGRICTSSQKFQDNLFDDNAIPPRILQDLAEINKQYGGVVERYIYQQFAKRQTAIKRIAEYLNRDSEEFDIEGLLQQFKQSKGLKKSIDKAYEITVYALFNAVLDATGVKVEISVDAEKLRIMQEFEELIQRLVGVSLEQPTRHARAQLFRAGVANAADRGIDMWANFEPIVQVKHIDLQEDLAEDIVENTTADEVVIVCRDADAEVIHRLTSQLGHRIRGIIRESELVGWYRVAFGKYRSKLGEAILANLRASFREEFPFSEEFPQFYKERGYDTLSKPDTECPFWQPDFQ
jgi:type II restriction enzyme